MNRNEISLEDYRRLRMIMRSHQNAVVATIPRPTFLRCAKKLKVLEGRKLLLDSDSELTILMDYCIYSHGNRGGNLVRNYLGKRPGTDDPDEQQVQAAMRQDRFSMYGIEQVQGGTGVSARDLVRGDTLFVVDEALSKTMRKNRILGGRLIPLADHWITTGAAFPVSHEAMDVVERFFLPALKLTEGGVSSLSSAAHEELATVLIGAALQEGTTSEIEYR